jgi:hypothetical protein
VTSENHNNADKPEAPAWVSAPSAYQSSPVGETQLDTKEPLFKKRIVWASAAVLLLVIIAVVARSRRGKGESATGAAGARDRIAALARDRASSYIAQAQNAVPSRWPTAVRNTLSSIPRSKNDPLRRAMSHACHIGNMAKDRVATR